MNASLNLRPPAMIASRKDLMKICHLNEEDGTRGGGRTHNLRLRKPTLYPIELRAHGVIFYSPKPSGKQTQQTPLESGVATGGCLINYSAEEGIGATPST
jgi:hypothetical protein